MKLYISGPITGRAYNEAFSEFEKAEEALRDLGFTTVNPMTANGLDGDGKYYAWAEYMKRDIALLLECDGLYMLPRWKKSRGACLELHIAKSLEMPIVYADPDGILDKNK